MNIAYDRDGDVLYVTLSGRDSYGVPSDKIPNVIVRKDMETNEITGVTIALFSKLPIEEIREAVPFDLPPRIDLLRMLKRHD